MKTIKESIDLKIFSVVLLIVIVMVGVSIVNVRLEKRVCRERGMGDYT
jgi:hypothetical protein